MTYNLGGLFEAGVDAVSDRAALVVGDQRLTYAELDERVNRLAHHLSSAGIGPGDHVGLHLSNCSAYIEGMFAAWKLRAVPVNINYRYVERELRYLYDDADLVAVIYHRRFADRLAEVAPATRLVVDDGSDDEPIADSTPYEDALSESDPARPQVDGRSGDDLYITYTGGTTGMPKGVVWRHEDVFKAAMGGGDLAQQGDYVRDADELRERVAASDHRSSHSRRRRSCTRAPSGSPVISSSPAAGSS